MTSCASVQFGAVWWETSAPLLLQNPLITWFYLCVGFFISKEGGEKKGHKHTKSIQMTTKEMQLQETHSPPALLWAHSGWAACEAEWEDEPVVLPDFPAFWWSLWLLNWCGLRSAEIRHAAEWWFCEADQDIMTALSSHARHFWEMHRSHLTDFTACGVHSKLIKKK